ncbi:MAG: T9SS type A sorting domain-containing protein [Bacteroidetes bacterium]|nr:T9SS type A sorting domain-containing protein [Bacteroidota bacterium]MCW5896828.1 T9SS type A sorting domain-containing protein [Bacteroidota bacterium]
MIATTRKWGLALVFLLSLCIGEATRVFCQNSPDSVIFLEDFEFGPGLWQVTNGLWSVGEDTTLPSNVARIGKIGGGVLNGDVPATGFDTYLVSPPILLPGISDNEDLRIGFTHWYNINAYCRAYVAVRLDSAGNQGPWQTVSVEYNSNLNLDYWRDVSIIISQYAGRRVNIGFRLYGFCNTFGCPSGRGWRIDDVRVVKSRFRNNGLPIAWDFDQDWTVDADADKWWDNYGLFRVGTDTFVVPPSKPILAGTNLNRRHVPASSYTVRLFSPSMGVPALGTNEDLLLRFRYTLERTGYTSAGVSVVEDSGRGRWSQETVLASYSTSTPWIAPLLTLPTSFSGKRIRVAFTFTGFCNTFGCPSLKGFHIDDVNVFTSNSVPHVPQPVFPRNDSVGTGQTPEFRWRISPAALRYRLQVSPDSTFQNNVLDVSSIDSLSFKMINALPSADYYYWHVKAANTVDSSAWSPTWRFRPIITVIEQPDEQYPNTFTLSQNYPNPFNPESKISFQIPIASDVTLKVYDLLGREVATLVNERMNPGTYSATWNAAGFASGVYFYRLQAGSASAGSAQGFVETRKLLLLR